MHRSYHRWYSPSLHRDMELLIIGHAGARVLVFPTSFGRFHEWEDRGLIGALRGHVEQGWLQFYCVDAVDTETWYNKRCHPAHRVIRQNQYYGYLLNEVLPLSRQVNPNPFMITTGASFGAYHAATFGLRFPDCVGRIIGMSGMYDIRRFSDGYYDENLYFNNPVDFIGNEHDPWRLARLRQMDVILAVGRDDAVRASNEYLSGQLWSKGIGNALRIWDGFAHDWPVWEKMLPLYIGGHD
jgi:esterase/lipase superfamily enzyme